VEAAKKRAEREAQRVEAAKKKAEWEEKKAEWEERRVEAAKKKAEWEARKAEWATRTAEREKKAVDREARLAEAQLAEKNSRMPLNDLDVQSEADSEASTIASTAVYEKEVERRVMMDREVRKLMKLLREIEKLEGRSDLDILQTAKLARKEEVELELVTSQGLAKVRAQNELRKQVCS